jgi:hypothetical protein
MDEQSVLWLVLNKTVCEKELELERRLISEIARERAAVYGALLEGWILVGV